MVTFFLLAASLALKPCRGPAETQYQAALQASQQGNNLEAEKLFRQAVESDLQCAKAHFNLGLTIAAEDRFAEAEPELRSALRLSPADPRIYTALGTVFDIASGRQLPQFATGASGPICGTPWSAVTTDATSGKVFWVSNVTTVPTVQIFTGATLVKTGQFEMHNLTGFPRMLVRPSPDSLALLMDDGFVVVMQGSILQP